MFWPVELVIESNRIKEKPANGKKSTLKLGYRFETGNYKRIFCYSRLCTFLNFLGVLLEDKYCSIKQKLKCILFCILTIIASQKIQQLN